VALTETEAVALISGGVAVVNVAVTGFVTYRVTSRSVAAARDLAREERTQNRRPRHISSCSSMSHASTHGSCGSWPSTSRASLAARVKNRPSSKMTAGIE